MKKFLGLVVLTMIATTSASFAGGCGGNDHAHSQQDTALKYFKKIDVNGDQVIDREEFEKSQASSIIKSFDVLNPNENGTINKEAFVKAFLKAHSKSEIEA